MPTPRTRTPAAPALERFTQKEVMRLVGITPRQMGRWERLRLVEPRAVEGEKAYTFADLVSLRTLKQLTGRGVSAARLLGALEILRREQGGAQVPLAEVRIRPGGRKLAIEYEGKALEPFTGQLLFKFDADEPRLRAMPSGSAQEWLARALECEADSSLRPQAIEAYLEVVKAAPEWAEPHLNLGTLRYEQGELLLAAECFRRALELEPTSALAHFNLGSVLDELKHFGEACAHLCEAVRLQPDFADAHYNLARVYEELGNPREARPHWRRYLELDPHSSWARYARQRLGTPAGC
jgi:tetratricopeptide (TPR) repeat protein